eukprot:207839_1
MASTFTPFVNSRKTLLIALKECKFSDVTFIVGESKEEIKANRFLLASHSPVFEAMLYGNMVEASPDAEIEIKDTKPAIFHSMLKYMYCNDPVITAHNFLQLRAVADKYLCEGLIKVIDEYFTKGLRADNVCVLLQEIVTQKKMIYIQKLNDVFKNKLAKFATDIVESDAFLKMNVDSMKVFLQIDHLEIKEEALWRHVLKWSEYHKQKKESLSIGMPPPKKKQKLNDGVCDDNKRQVEQAEQTTTNQSLKEVAKFIRFPLMDGKFFLENVKEQKCLTESEMVLILSYYIDKKYSTDTNRCGPFSTQPRCTDKETKSTDSNTFTFTPTQFSTNNNQTDSNFFFTTTKQQRRGRRY